MNAKKRLYEGLIVPTELYGAENFGKYVSVFELCLQSVLEMIRMDRVRNKDLCGG